MDELEQLEQLEQLEPAEDSPSTPSTTAIRAEAARERARARRAATSADLVLIDEAYEASIDALDDVEATLSIAASMGVAVSLRATAEGAIRIVARPSFPVQYPGLEVDVKGAAGDSILVVLATALRDYTKAAAKYAAAPAPHYNPYPERPADPARLEHGGAPARLEPPHVPAPAAPGHAFPTHHLSPVRPVRASRRANVPIATADGPQYYEGAGYADGGGTSSAHPFSPEGTLRAAPSAGFAPPALQRRMEVQGYDTRVADPRE